MLIEYTILLQKLNIQSTIICHRLWQRMQTEQIPHLRFLAALSLRHHIGCSAANIMHHTLCNSGFKSSLSWLVWFNRANCDCGAHTITCVNITREICVLANHYMLWRGPVLLPQVRQLLISGVGMGLVCESSSVLMCIIIHTYV